MSGFGNLPGKGGVDIDKIEGLPAWDNTVIYTTGNNVKESGKIWESLQNGNLNHLPSGDNASNPVWWKEISSSHVHQNKSLLDSITATLIAAWNTAFAKSHDQNTDSGTDKGAFNLGAALTAGADRLLEAIGNLANISITIKTKGTGALKLAGAKYVVTKDKILVINISGEVVAQYNIEDEFVATPPTLTYAGTPGQKAWDGTHLFYCVTASLWIKVFALSADIDFMEILAAVPPAYNYPGQVCQIAWDLQNGLKYEHTGSQWVRYQVTTVF